MNKRTIMHILLFILINSLIFALPKSNIYNSVAIEPVKIDSPYEISNVAHDRIFINSDDDFVTYGFPGSGTENDPYLIAGYTISTTNDEPCIEIRYTTAYFIIRDCILNSDQSRFNIKLNFIAANTLQIINNTMTQDFEHESLSSLCIFAFGCDGLIVKDNWFSSIGTGCKLEQTEYSIVHNNDINTAERGIEITCSLFTNVTENHFISTNTSISIIGSSYIGIYNNTINQAIEEGIFLYKTANSFIAGNNIQDVTKYGIEIFESNDNIVCYNWIESCDSYGLRIYGYDSEDCQRNEIHHNVFIDNNLGSSQAYDNGIDNLFYDDKDDEGNYWSDWGGGSYSIDGGNSDPYPLSAYPVIIFSNLDIHSYPSDDAYEENDYTHEAKYLSPNGFYTLIMLDMDNFMLVLEQFQTLNVTIYHSQINNKVNLDLYHGSTRIIENDAPEDGFSFEYDCLESGEYRLLTGLIPCYGVNVTSYSLNITAAFNLEIDDIYEENDIFEEAVEYDNYGYEDLIYSDRDYYKISYHENASLIASISYDSLDTNLDLYLLPHDYDGNPSNILAQSATNDFFEEIEYVIEENKEYILYVTSRDPDGIPPLKPVAYSFYFNLGIETNPFNAISIFLTIITMFSLAIIVKKFKK